MSAFGQNTTAARPDRGANPGGTYAVSDIESTNLQNGNVSLSIPLASLPPIAGGKLSLTISAHYNSKLWNITREEVLAQEFPTYQTYVRDTPQQSDRGGWLIGGGYSIIFRDARDDFNYLVPPYAREPAEWQRLSNYTWRKAILLTPDGAEHELRPQDPAVAYFGIDSPRDYLRMFYKDTPDTTGNPMRYATLDGTYLSVLINPYGSSDPVSWTIFMPDGTRVIQHKNGIQRIVDPNGNSIKIFATDDNGINTAHYQDEQTGREIKITSNYANGYLQYQVWYQTVGGGWAHTDVNFGETSVKGKVYSVNGWNPNMRTETGDSEGAPCRHEQVLQETLMVVRSIVYPQTEPGVAARQFTFSYNSDTTQTDTTNRMRWMCGLPETYTRTVSYGMGGLSRIVMPTGAIVDYTYSNDGVHDFVGRFPGLPTQEDEMAREVLRTKKITHDNNVVEQWTYDIPTSGEATMSSVINPDGSGTTELYYPTDPRFNQIMSGSGSIGLGGLVYRTLEERQATDRRWVLLSPNGQGIPGTGMPGNVLGTINPVVAAEYTTIRDANNVGIQMNARMYQHDFNGNVTQVKEYDWFDPTQVTRDAFGVPIGVPANATLLRVTNTSYHNPVGDSAANLYSNRTLVSGTPLFLNAPKETSIAASVTRYSYDGQGYGAAPTAGNATSVSSFDDRGDTNPTNDAWVTVSKAYGAYGNVSSTTDARGKITSFFYDDATHAAPTRVVVDPANDTGKQTTITAYDYATGLVTAVTDPNGQTSTTDYTNQLLGTVDPFGRPGIQLSPPVRVNGTSPRRRVKIVYHDSAQKVTVTSDLNAENDGLLRSETFYDQLGRTTESRQYETSTSYVTVRQKYDAMGRVSQVSNPYRPPQAPMWTTTVYDLSARVTSVTTPDNAVVTTTYDGSFVTVTDQAGKLRRSYTDGLGRLTRVDEPDANGNLGTTSAPAQPTSYTYDAVGNLRQVTQGGQRRYFMYDSLGRLLRAKNPEQASNPSLNTTDPVTGNTGWSLGYAYDANGNLTRRTDARGVVSVYTYDGLNRNTSVDYQNVPADPANSINPDTTRVYDGATLGKGRFWYDYQGGNYSSGAQVEHRAVDAYDALGRPLSQRQMFKTNGAWSAAYTTGRSYHLAGGVKTQTYPSGHTVNYTQDAAGRTAGLTGDLGDGVTRTYAAHIVYDEANRLAREEFGTQTPLYHKLRYNSRGQLYDVRLSSGRDADNWNRGMLQTHYSHHNGVWAAEGADDNGNALRTHHYIPNDEQVSGYTLFYQDYEYDALNRLKKVMETNNAAWAVQYTQAYDYDRWGNRTINAGLTWGAGVNNKQFTVNAVTNRLEVPAGQVGAMTYDAAGNLTDDQYTGAGLRAYDAENRLTGAAIGINGSASYGYDADGRRVRRQTPAENVWQVYGIDSELLAEYAAGAAPSAPQTEYGYRNGELLVTAAAGTNVALNKPATQSSTFDASVPAARAVDGNTSGTHASGTISHTNSQAQAWWQVDLGGAHTIDSIKVWNRADCCTQTTGNFYVFVSDAPFTSTDLTATLGQAGVSNYQVSGEAGRPTTLTANRTGRYVRVQLAETNYLTLSEVEVLGTARPTNLALNQTATQSSTFDASVPARRAVDGTTAGTHASGTISHTNLDAQAWWQVDLASVQPINSVKVWNRADCCTSTTRAFYVLVSDAPFTSTDLATTRNQAGVSNYYVTGAAGAPTTLTVGRSGRYVRVQLAGTNYLTLSEVEVFGSTQGSRAAQVNWLVTDHLGTPRMLADLTGSLSGIKRHDYLPFGEELSAGMGGRTTAQGYSQVDNVRQGFTGYEKDIETGLDFAQARYYASTQGRFISVDPALDSAQSAMPQSWNRYTYCLNNPLRFIDPTGMRWAQKYNEEDKKWYYSWFGKDEDYNNAIENDGFSAVDFDESKPYEFLARGGSETQLWVILNPDGTNILDSRGTPGAAPGIDMMEGQAFELAAGNVAGKAITSVFNRVFGSLFSRASSVTNPVPSTLARAIPGEGPFPTLGRIGAEEVFVTAADDIASMSASQIGPRLGIRNSDVFTIIEFPTPRVGLACPINRADPGFVGFGRTTGGAREFVLPNGPIPANATTRIVR